MDKFTINAIIPDSSTIICGLMDTVSDLTRFWLFVETFQVIYFVSNAEYQARKTYGEQKQKQLQISTDTGDVYKQLRV